MRRDNGSVVVMLRGFTRERSVLTSQSRLHYSTLDSQIIDRFPHNSLYTNEPVTCRQGCKIFFISTRMDEFEKTIQGLVVKLINSSTSKTIGHDVRHLCCHTLRRHHLSYHSLSGLDVSRSCIKRGIVLAPPLLQHLYSIDGGFSSTGWIM
ncbi:hypothetical protein J6590_043965 [Homalodisca vitripennis]|nr:hypothetical protein J6590_043965 [Homalodisca vitripennis]